MVNVNVIGRLAADAEILEGKNGKFVSFRLAVSDFNEGEKTTTWFRITGFDERTMKLAPYLKKGNMVNVIGTEGVRMYKDRNGETQVARDIRLNTFDFISTGNGEGKEQPHATENVTTGELKEPTPVTPEPKLPDVKESDSDDDLPF